MLRQKKFAQIFFCHFTFLSQSGENAILFLYSSWVDRVPRIDAKPSVFFLRALSALRRIFSHRGSLSTIVQLSLSRPRYANHLSPFT